MDVRTYLTGKPAGEIRKLLWAIPFFVVPPVVGFLIGWFVGASRVPAVASLIPLLFGLGGAYSYAFVDKTVKRDSLADELAGYPEIRTLEENQRRALFARFGAAPQTQNWLPIYWTCAIVVFCLSLFWGTESGISRRFVEYPSLDELIGVSSDKITPLEAAHLTRACWVLRSRNVPAHEAQSVFHEVFGGIYSEFDLLFKEISAMESGKVGEPPDKLPADNKHVNGTEKEGAATPASSDVGGSGDYVRPRSPHAPSEEFLTAEPHVGDGERRPKVLAKQLAELSNLREKMVISAVTAILGQGGAGTDGRLEPQVTFPRPEF